MNSKLSIVQVSKSQPVHSDTLSSLRSYFATGEGLSVSLGLVFLLILAAIFSKRKGQLTSARFVSRSDKLNATILALQQLKNRKCQPCTLWSGTPAYWFVCHKSISAYLQTLLGSPPTVWFPHAERGILVIGAPGSGKTFSVIDRAIESAFAQGMSVLIYDKKGDQMKQHVPLAVLYGYDVEVFAPGEPYSGVINPLDFVRDATDATMAGEIGKVIIGNSSSGEDKGDKFFRASGEQLTKGLIQLAKGSLYPDLAMVYALIQLPNFVQRLERAVYRNDEKQLDRWVAASFSQLLSSKDAEKTVAGIKATAELTFSSFIQKDLLRAFIGKSTIPLKLDKKQLIVFKLDDQRRTVIAPLLAAAIHLCIVSNLAQKRKNPFVYSLDEFPSIELDRIVNWVNEYRSNGGVPIVGIQSLNQLYDTYGDKQGAAIASALSTHVLFNPGDYDTAEKYSKRYGEAEIMLRNRSTGTSTGPQTNRSINWSEQIHKKALIGADEIMRFPQGKCVITSPAYGDGKEAAFPYLLKIPVRKGDRLRAQECETLWDKTVCAQLEQRVVRQQQLRNSARQTESDWVSAELDKRVKAAYQMLPLEAEEITSAKMTETTKSDRSDDVLKNAYINDLVDKFKHKAQ
jgi:type IV secretion system protein VirD4